MGSMAPPAPHLLAGKQLRTREHAPGQHWGPGTTCSTAG